MNYESQLAGLARLKHLGFEPQTIIDCGSALGEWSELARLIFPEPKIYAFDPIHYTTPDENSLKYPKINNIQLTHTLLGADGENVTFYMYNQVPKRSSFFPEFTDMKATEISATTRSLDSFFSAELPAPVLVKLDTQGSELEILKNAPQTLSKTDVVVLEVSTISGNKNAPEFYEIVKWFFENDFALYDMLAAGYRGFLVAQFDAIFVRKSHPIRKIF